MRRIAKAAGLLMMLFGCGAKDELRAIGESRKAKVSERAPVVVFLPGTLASRLINRETGEVVWGAENALSVDPRTREGLRQLALPLTDVSSDMSAATDDVGSLDILRRAATRMMGIRLSTPVYDDALAGFAAAGLDVTEPQQIPDRGASLVPFPYDWRRSIADGALELGAALEARGEGAEKVTLLGHSMGGAVALYYLMFGAQPFDPQAPMPEITWAGAEHVSRAILVAPPLRGSAVAIRNTVNGNKLAGPLIPVYPPAMLASHPSTFELMPRNEAVSVFEGDKSPQKGAHLDPDYWESKGWGLVGPSSAQHREWLARGAGDPEELASARQSTLMERGAAFHAAFDRPLDPPEGLELVVLAGKGRKTPSAVTVQDAGGVKVTHHTDGDGVVPFSSASAGFLGAAPSSRKRLIDVDAPHARIMSEPEVFRQLLDLLAH